MSTTVSATAELATLHELNQGYVRAARDSDVGWYEAHLDDVYMSFDPNGSLVERAGFLERIARPKGGARYEAVDARIRFIGDLGIIRSGFRMAKASGESGGGSFTDIWSRRTGRSLCISAHFALFDVPMRPDAPIAPGAEKLGSQSDRAILGKLNADFIRSVRESDAHWFDANLNGNFLNSNPDGSISGRADLLA